MTGGTESGAERAGWNWRQPSYGSIVVLLVAIVGIRVGLTPLKDNSFLTHLATGRLILEDHSVPGADPYSWTAYGDPWTVQSWGASVLYASAERLFGMVGIRLLNAVCITALCLLVWRLTQRAVGLVGRLLVTALVVAMGTTLWVERPLIFGMLFLALTLLAVEDQLDPRWLIPIMWLWVNTHGSFPLGLGAIVLFGAGRWLDQHARPLIELRVLAWATLGTLLGAISPVGPKLLVFPLQILSRPEAFERVSEWDPPRWDKGVEQVFALMLVLTVVLVLSRDRRWRSVLPLVVFAAAALSSTRNIAPACLILTPIMAGALHGVGRLQTDSRPDLLRPVAVALVLVIGFATYSGLSEPDTALIAYPEEAATWMQSQGLLDLDARVISRDYVGNYLEYRYGPDDVRVFFDDRVDMYPLSLIRDYGVLITPGADFQPVFDRYEATSVLWDRRSVLGKWLEASDAWTVAFRDEKWLVAVPS